MEIQTIIGKEFYPKVTPLIAAARNSICIISYDWRWYPADPGNPVQLFTTLLIKKAKLGVDVRAVLNSNNIVYLLKQNGIAAKRKRFSKFLHSKLILIDSDVTIIGSHNLTLSAFQFNMECSVILYDKTVNETFKKFFETLWL